MTVFADQVAALLDHLGLEPRGGRRHLAGRQRGARAGRSATRPASRGCSSRCPCSTTPWSPSALIFTPILLGAAARRARPAAASPPLARRIPRTQPPGRHRARLGPAATRALGARCSRGLFLGRTAPHREERAADRAADAGDRPPAPTRSTPSADSGMLAEELPNARLVEAELDPRVAAHARAASTTSWPRSSTTSGRAGRERRRAAAERPRSP